MNHSRPQYAEPGLFAGADYIPLRDDRRLLTQIDRIRNFMADGQWRTFEEIAAVTGDPTPSISAQLRHLREPKHGAYTVEKCYCGEGLYRYRVSGGEPCQLPLIRRRA